MAITRETVDNVECWTTDLDGVPLDEIGNNAADVQAANAKLLVDKKLGLTTDLQAAEAAAAAAVAAIAAMGDVVGSDVADFATAAQGALADTALQPGGSPQFTAVNLGHASDTTLTRAGAGVAAVEGINLLRAYVVVEDSNEAITLATATHTNKQLDCTASGGAITVTFDATNGCSVGDDGIIRQADGTQAVTVTADGVTFQPAGDKTTTDQWDVIYWKCVATNTFMVVGGQIEANEVANVAKVVELQFTINNTDGAVPTGLAKPKACPVTGNIVEVQLTRSSATSGTTTLDISVEDDGGLPVAGDTICASDKLSITSTAVTASKTSFTGWSLGVNRGDLVTPDIEANNDSDFIHISILIEPTE